MSNILTNDIFEPSRLWALMVQEHGLTLTDSQEHDIIQCVKAMILEQSTVPAPDTGNP